MASKKRGSFKNRSVFVELPCDYLRPESERVALVAADFFGGNQRICHILRLHIRLVQIIENFHWSILKWTSDVIASVF